MERRRKPTWSETNEEEPPPDRRRLPWTSPVVCCPSAAARDADVRTLVVAGEDLARTRDLLLFVRDHLFPLGEPADGTWDGEHHRVHLDGDLECLVDEARVEIDVGVELALDEVVVRQRDAL